MNEIELALAKLHSGALARETLPMIEEVLQAMEKAALNKAFASLESPEGLPPQQALSLMTEIWGYHRLKRRLTQAVQVGGAAGEALTPYMGGPINA